MLGNRVIDVDEKKETATCTYCGQRVRVRRNEDAFWESVSHSYTSRRKR
jgi:hypothetical protein